MKPEFGAYSMLIAGTATSSWAVPQYPKDGKGTVTETADDSIVRDTTESVILAITADKQGADNDLRIFHGDDTLAYILEVHNGPADPYEANLPAAGLRVLGNWYAQFGTNIDPRASVLFKVIA